MNNLGRVLISAGVVFILAGIIFTVFSRLKIPLGRLPGDIIIQRERFTFYFPLATSIIVSVILSAVLYLFFRK